MVDAAQDVHTLNIYTLLEEIGDQDDQIQLLECQLEDARRECRDLTAQLDALTAYTTPHNYRPEDYCD